MITLRQLPGENSAPRYAIYSGNLYAGNITTYRMDEDTLCYGILVCKSMRRQGIAGAALPLLMESLRARGIRRLVAKVDSGNTASLALHHAAGFTPVRSENSDVCLFETHLL
ncbi:MAG: GNAT family N-acetyltransferase [Clostridia bacterium]|nr:GNAT family N-acetyltransferase [Clostridia bacterium]